MPIIEDKLPGKVFSTIGDCGEQSSFSLNGFIEKVKGFIAREEQATSVNWLTTPQASSEKYQPPSTFSTLSSNVSTRCQFCNGPHAASHCNMTSSDKTSAVIRGKLCLNCLYSGHLVAACTARGRFAKCKGKHHASIHRIRIHPTAGPTQAPREKSTNYKPPSQTTTKAAIPIEDTSIAKHMPSSSRSTVVNCAVASSA